MGDLDGDNDSDLFIWDDGGTFYFENQLYDSTSFCDSVTGLSTINVLPMKAKLTWDSIPGASKYRVFYKEAGVPGSPSTKNSVDNIRVVNGLSPSTTYQARVKALCLGLGWSAFSAPIFFTTPIMRESGFCHADVPADSYSYGQNLSLIHI